jgi:hypothetical protein
MGYRGFLKPGLTPLTLIRGPRAVMKGLWASKTVGSRAIIGSLLGLMLGVGASLFAWWLCKEPFPFTGRSHEDLWETVSLPQLFFWGHRWWDADHCATGDVCFLLATNGLLLGLFGGLAGWYVGRLRRLRPRISEGTQETGPKGRSIRMYWSRIWRQACWGFCVGLALSLGAFIVLLLKEGAEGGEQRVGFWWMLLRPSLALGIPWPQAGYRSLMLVALASCTAYGALFGMISGTVAALLGPPRAPAEPEDS